MPPDLTESIIKITRERRIDAALLTMIREYLQLKTKDIERRINEYEKKHGMSFQDFKEACKSEKIDAYSHQIEEDYREWEALHSLKKYYGELLNKWLIGQ